MFHELGSSQWGAVWSTTQEAREKDTWSLDVEVQLKFESNCLAQTITEGNSRQLTQGLVTCLKSARRQFYFLSTSHLEESDVISMCSGRPRALVHLVLKDSGVIILMVLMLGYTLELF